MSHRASLRLTFPANVVVTGQTVTGQRAKLREIVIPLQFPAAKAQALAATVEIIGLAGEGEKPTEASVWDGTLQVSGKNGNPSIQKHQRTSVDPAFLSLLGELRKPEDEEDEGEEEDDGDEDEEDEGEEDEGEEDEGSEEGEDLS